MAAIDTARSSGNIVFLPEGEGKRDGVVDKIRAVKLPDLEKSYSASGSWRWGVGAKDCAVVVITAMLIVSMVIPLFKLAGKVCAFAMDFFKKPLSNTKKQRKALENALKNKVMTDYNPSEHVGDEAVSCLHNAALTLRCCINVAERMGISLGDVDLGGIEKRVNDPSYDAGRAKEIKKAFKKGLIEEFDKETFEYELTKERGRQLPAKLEQAFKIGKNKVREKTVSLNASIGAKYLSVAGDYTDQVDYIKSHRQGDNWGQRCSQAKEGNELQGMVLNGRVHTAFVNDKKVEEIYRSGAFAIHGRGKTGLSRLKEMKAELDKSDNDEILGKLSKEWQVEKSFVKTKLKNEIKFRTDMTVAQALPKICQSIRSMALDKSSMEMAAKTGRFLHVEQSLLSDLEGNELGMIQDMKGGIDHIREKAKVKFVEEGEDSISVDDKGNILITLKVDIAPQGTFGIHAVFFTQGVSIGQSKGFALGRTLHQDKINSRG